MKAVVNAVLVKTKGKGGYVALRDILPNNVPGVYIKVTVQGKKVIQAFPEIR